MNPPAKINHLDRAQELTGVDPHEMREWIEGANWSRDQFIAAVKNHDNDPDWFDALKREARARAVEAAALAIGPRGFTDLSREKTLEIVKHTALKRLIETYDGGPVVILGPTELGKSITAVELLRERRRRSRAVAVEEISNPRFLFDRYTSYVSECHGRNFKDGWISAANLAVAMRESKLGEHEANDIRLAKSEPLVCIDDITWPSARDDITLDVLASRYDAGLPSIVTAGCTKQQLLQRFGDAAVRRMLELRGKKGILVDLNGSAK